MRESTTRDDPSRVPKLNSFGRVAGLPYEQKCPWVRAEVRAARGRRAMRGPQRDDAGAAHEPAPALERV